MIIIKDCQVHFSRVQPAPRTPLPAFGYTIRSGALVPPCGEPENIPASGAPMVPDVPLE